MTTAASVWAYPLAGAIAGQRMAQAASLNTEVHRISGLDAASPLVVAPTARTAGSIVQAISQAGDSTTVTRTA